MAERTIAPPEDTRTEIEIGLVFEDVRTGDRRKVVYTDSRVVVSRDEDGNSTLTPLSAFDSLLGNRYRARPEAELPVDGGQLERLRERIAEYDDAEGRKATHYADAMREALDVLTDDAPVADALDEVDFEAVDGIGPETAATLRARGFVTHADVRSADDEALLAVSGIGPANVAAIRDAVSEDDPE
ncbi:MAG: helix-hairpin-helix domain-containing protein [Haloarculaceae archaeon]